MPKKAKITPPVTPRAGTSPKKSRKKIYTRSMSFIGFKKDEDGNIYSLNPMHRQYQALKFELVHGYNRAEKDPEIAAKGIQMSEEEKESIKLSQAERVILKFGGPKQMAETLKQVDDFSGTKWSHSTIYRWLYPPQKGGTNGIIPTDKMEVIRKVARYCGVHISEDDLLPIRK